MPSDRVIVSPKEVAAVPCGTCGAAAGERCIDDGTDVFWHQRTRIAAAKLRKQEKQEGQQ